MHCTAETQLNLLFHDQPVAQCWSLCRKTHRIRSPDVHVHTLYCTDHALHHMALQTAYSHTDTGSRDRRPSAVTRRRRAQRARQLTTQPRCRADTHAAARLRAPGRRTAASEQAPRRGTVARVPSRETGHHCLLCGLSFSPRGVAWSSICAVYTHSVSVQSESTQRKQYWPVSLEGNRVAV